MKCVMRCRSFCLNISFHAMRLVIISDTHGKHSELSLPEGDMIIHAGDVSRKGSRTEVSEFLSWFSSLNFKHRIFIPGNHDFFFEKESQENIRDAIPDNVVYLNDSSVAIGELKIWGSPVTPWFYDWAFNRQRGTQIEKHWSLIPSDTNILVTHGPAYGIFDRTVNREHVGCRDLLRRIGEVNPAFHICGHIHEGYGRETCGETEFINASVLNEKYELVNKPVIIDL